MKETPTVSRINFAKCHGYKYVGNGWFLPIDKVVTVGQFKRITGFSINERIELKKDMIGLCAKHNVYIMVYILKRWKEKHIYGTFLFNSQY